jgi:hypothetical protein
VALGGNAVVADMRLAVGGVGTVEARHHPHRGSSVCVYVYVYEAEQAEGAADEDEDTDADERRRRNGCVPGAAALRCSLLPFPLRNLCPDLCVLGAGCWVTVGGVTGGVQRQLDGRFHDRLGSAQ